MPRRPTSTTSSRSCAPSGSTRCSSRGDVYDRALPAPDTVELLSEAVTRLVDAGAQVVLSSGNHDSAIRLGFAVRLLERAGLHLRTRSPTSGRPVLLGDTAVLPPALPRAGHWPPTRSAPPSAPTPACCAPRWSGCAPTPARAARRHRWSWPTPSSPAGSTSESERDISVGGVSAVPARASSPASTTPRSGHLHGPQAGQRHGSATAAPRWPCRSARRAHQGLLAGRPRPARTAGRRARRGARSTRPLRRAARHPRRPARRPGARRRGGRLVPGHPHRRRTPARGDGPGPPALPAHPRAAVRARRARTVAAAALRRAGRDARRPRRVLRLPRPRARRAPAPPTRAGAARRGRRGPAGVGRARSGRRGRGRRVRPTAGRRAAA